MAELSRNILAQPLWGHAIVRGTSSPDCLFGLGKKKDFYKNFWTLFIFVYIMPYDFFPIIKMHLGTSLRFLFELQRRVLFRDDKSNLKIR